MEKNNSYQSPNKFSEEEILQFIYGEITPQKREEIMNVLYLERNLDLAKAIHQRIIVKRDYNFKNTNTHLKWYNDSKNRTQELLNKKFFPKNET